MKSIRVLFLGGVAHKQVHGVVVRNGTPPTTVLIPMQSNDMVLFDHAPTYTTEQYKLREAVIHNRGYFFVYVDAKLSEDDLLEYINSPDILLQIISTRAFSRHIPATHDQI